jgi:hypothetical protein
MRALPCLEPINQTAASSSSSSSVLTPLTTVVVTAPENEHHLLNTGKKKVQRSSSIGTLNETAVAKPKLPALLEPPNLQPGTSLDERESNKKSGIRRRRRRRSKKLFTTLAHFHNHAMKPFAFKKKRTRD